MTDFERAQSLLGFWMGCVASGRDLVGEEPIPDDAPILNFLDMGATAIVTWGDLKALCKPEAVGTYLVASELNPDKGHFLLTSGPVETGTTLFAIRDHSEESLGKVES